MPDVPNLDTTGLTQETSAKFVTLLNTIRLLDEDDMETQNTKYKHFIFTDLRESAYGAKALASFMIANGYDLRMGLEKKMIKRHGEMVETKTGETALIDKEPVEGGSNGFAILQSLPLWKNPLSVKTKKDILRVFNSRPDNIHGERLRIILLDSKFKEGIDLFDVKYVHLLEPPIANSDLKQAVGRATRFCGQKGLSFVPNKGWALHVYIYSVQLPKRAPFLFQGVAEEGAAEEGVAEAAEANEETIDAHDLMLAKSGIDLALLNLVKELTILAISSSVDYDLNYRINNFDIEESLLETNALVAEVANQSGGGKQNAPQLVQIHTMKDITPELLQKCYKRKTKLFPFTRARMERDARRLGMRIPKQAKRAWYCEQLRTHPLYLETLLKPEVDRTSVTTLGDRDSRNSLQSEHNSISNSNSASNIALSRVRSLFPSPQEFQPSIQDLLGNPEKQDERLQDLPNQSAQEFRKSIAEMYQQFKWASPVVKNGCEAIVAGQQGQQGKPVQFTNTQNFVRHYLVPKSPYKGLLAWHSVGTGKTCMAVAAATTQFEKEGYTILWVTRNSLMADVYKNIFGSICSIPIMEEVEKGNPVPQDFQQQKRMLSKAWFPPISYRTFQNALEGKNELGRLLKKKGDPLRKTFLVMDEVHKLQDGDLGGAESADFGIIQSYIHKSYEMSNKDSVRPLLMTATPITDSPNSLFDILNTLIDKPNNRLMPFQQFRESFTTQDGTILPEGKEYFQAKTKGLISYLNREYDPTTFAQPVFHKIAVPIKEEEEPHSAEDIANQCQPTVVESLEPLEPLEDLEQELEAIEQTEKEKKKAKTQIKRLFTQRQKRIAKEQKAEVRVCYNTTKKAYLAKTKTNQLHSVEACFGKQAPQFPSFQDVLSLIKN